MKLNDYYKSQMDHKETREMFETIFDIAKRSKYKNALEIGVAWGISTMAILQAGTGKLLSVDKSLYQNTIDQVHEYGLQDRWTYLVRESSCLKELGGQYDLICVDGDHRYEYVKADLDNSIKFKPKVIIIDDYNHRYNFEEREDQYGVKMAVDEFVKENNFKLIVHKKANGIGEVICEF